MSGDIAHRVLLGNGGAQLLKRLVLRRLKTQAFQAFELDANGVIIAALAPSPLADAGMPGPVVAADELPDLSLARDEEVGRNLQATNALVVRMGVPVQLIGEQLLDCACAELARRQADGVNDDQVYLRRFRAWTEVG